MSLTIHQPSPPLTDREKLCLLAGFMRGIANRVERSVARLSDVEPRVPRGVVQDLETDLQAIRDECDRVTGRRA